VLHDKDNDFGKQVLTALQETKSQYIVMAVDEMIWLRPIDLRQCSCLLRQVDGQAFGFQLRLGYNIGSMPQGKLRSGRFYPIGFDNEIVIYYPLQLAYDFGYVLNVDGLLANKFDILRDLDERLLLIRNPGQLEMHWIYQRLHVRNRQWQFMFNASRLVNNMGMADGRVADTNAPKQGSYELAEKILHKHQMIDTDKFTNDNVNKVTSTHHTFPVDYIDFKCNI
jgi:hypothetical protein